MPRMLANATAEVKRTLGYLGNGPMLGLGHRFGPNPAAFGVEGLGGQFAFCDRTSQIGVGYVRNDLAVADVLQPTLTKTLYRCARELGVPVYTPGRIPWHKAVLDSAAGAYSRRKLAVRA